MTDDDGLLQRLKIALPRVRTWIDELLSEHAARARPVASLGLPRFPEYFPDSVLSAVRAVTVARIPFPPIAAYGLPEVADLGQMGLAGITFTDMLFVDASQEFLNVYFRELVHAVQWHTLGAEDYLVVYVTGPMIHGYANSPLEIMAFDLQREFARGAPIPDIGREISAHARRTRAWTAELFRQAGETMGG